MYEIYKMYNMYKNIILRLFDNNSLSKNNTEQKNKNQNILCSFFQKIIQSKRIKIRIYIMFIFLKK